MFCITYRHHSSRFSSFFLLQKKTANAFTHQQLSFFVRCFIFSSDSSTQSRRRSACATKTDHSAEYFVPLPVPCTRIYPILASLFRIATVFDFPNPVFSVITELGNSLPFRRVYTESSSAFLSVPGIPTVGQRQGVLQKTSFRNFLSFICSFVIYSPS